MNTPVKWLVEFWKLEKGAEKMLEGVLSPCRNSSPSRPKKC